MEFSKSTKIEKAAAKEETRYAINDVWLGGAPGTDVTPGTDGAPQGHLVATNGRILAVVPVAVDENDVAGPVPAAALAAARKGRKKDPARIECNGAARVQKKAPGGWQDVATFPRRPDAAFSEADDAVRFPDWRGVIPSQDGKTFSVCLDAELLFRLAQAIGSDGAVRLTFHEDDSACERTGAPPTWNTLPARVEPICSPDAPAGAFGMIMPIQD